jgi:hypothetical protein
MGADQPEIVPMKKKVKFTVTMVSLYLLVEVLGMGRCTSVLAGAAYPDLLTLLQGSLYVLLRLTVVIVVPIVLIAEIIRAIFTHL